MAKLVRVPEAEQIKFQREVEASPEFKAIQAEMVQASRATRRNLKRKMEENAEYQRRKAMPQAEKTRGAIDRMAKSIKEFNEKAKGKTLTHEQCMAEARRIAKRALGTDV